MSRWTCPDCIKVRTDYYPMPCPLCTGYRAKENAA